MPKLLTTEQASAVVKTLELVSPVGGKTHLTFPNFVIVYMLGLRLVVYREAVACEQYDDLSAFRLAYFGN